MRPYPFYLVHLFLLPALKTIPTCLKTVFLALHVEAVLVAGQPLNSTIPVPLGITARSCHSGSSANASRSIEQVGFIKRHYQPSRPSQVTH